MKSKCFPKTLVQSKQGFSIVELLTVVGVMILLIGVTMQLVKGPGDSQKLRSAASLITGLSTVARQNSLGQNALTALVCLGKSGPAERGLRSLALFELRPHEDGTLTTANDWKQITPWKQLPEGVLIDDDASQSTFLSPLNVKPAPSLPVNLTVSGQSVNDYSFQVFQPNGRILGGKAVTLKLLPGILKNGSIQSTAAATKNDTKNYVVVSFISTTGQTKVFQP